MKKYFYFAFYVVHPGARNEYPPVPFARFCILDFDHTARGIIAG